MSTLVYKQEAYEIIGLCLEVHKTLGHGFLEEVYKEALSFEFRKKGIPFTREQRFEIDYKGHILKKPYYADFTVYGKIILEAKALEGIPERLYSQTLNYLKASNFKLGLLVNFGAPSLQSKRLVF